MKSWREKKEEIGNTASSGAIAGLGSPPDDFPVVRKKKKKLDGRTKEFREKVKQLEKQRRARQVKELKKKYNVLLGY